MSHLEDMVVKVPHGKETFKVLVIFSCHCFTEKFENHTPDLKYEHEKEVRAFSVQRHEYSRELPNLVRQAISRTVYHSRSETYFFVSTGDGTYAVYFDVIAGKNGVYDVIMNVQSAYEKKNLAETAAPVLFGNLIAATAQGNKAPLGKPVKIERG